MAISNELKKIYSNYDDSRMFYDTVQLHHPNFNVPADSPYPSETSYPSDTSYPGEIDYNAQSFYLIRDSADHTLKLEDGSSQIFQGYPFDVIQQEVGSDQVDIGIVLDNVSLEIIGNIELAAQNTSVPIQMTFSVYMEGDDTPQITPIQLALTEVVVDMMTVTCKASRTDLFKRKLPFGKNTYFLSNFEGLTI